MQICMTVSFYLLLFKLSNKLSTALRVEWAKAWARKRRYDEEVRFLVEETRRLPISLEYEASIWEGRAKAVQVGVIQPEYAQGLVAYALKQAAVFRDLAARARTTAMEARLPRGKKRPRRPAFDPLAAMPEDEPADEDPDEDPDDDSDEEEDEADERGDVGSDEEVIMGGEVDDE